MYFRILSVSLVWLLVGASAVSQTASPQNSAEQQKKNQQLEKAVKEALASAAAEVAQLKMPENRIYLRAVIADFHWRGDEKNARSAVDGERRRKQTSVIRVQRQAAIAKRCGQFAGQARCRPGVGFSSSHQTGFPA
jgi:hypothetical protein